MLIGITLAGNKLTSTNEGVIISSTNIQINSMMYFDPPFAQIRSRNDGTDIANALLNAINVKAIHPMYEKKKARTPVTLHHVSPNTHSSPKYKLV